VNEARYASVFRPNLLAGQVGVVTGGGSGIGRCIAHELASLGARVVLASRDREKLEAVRTEILEDGGQADVIPCDIRNEEQVKTLIADSVRLGGRLDFVINNGGGQFMAPLEAISLRGWHAVLETNLTGTFLVSREAVTQHMREHGGSIVNIVADMWRGMPLMAHSGAARAGVVNLTQSASLEWAQYGVRVNAVAPGIILSSGFKKYPEPVQEALRTLPEQIPARRFGTESEVSATVVFLVSPAASYITGATIRVDGASSLYRHPVSLVDHAPQPAFKAFHRRADLPEGLDE
jgi:citronellol/citronellal dehydrogenase